MTMENSAKERQILIVEDDPNMADIITLTLQQNGFEAAVVSSFEDAVRQMTKSKFLAIICDVNLGSDKYNGMDIFREASKGLHRNFFIFITGDSFDRSKFQRYLMPGTPEPQVLFKPFSIGRITSAIQNYTQEQKRQESKIASASSFVPNASAASPHQTQEVSTPKRLTPEEYPRKMREIRHNLANKVMIASENTRMVKSNLSKLATDIPNDKVAELEKRLETALKNFEMINHLLSDWRELGQAIES